MNTKQLKRWSVIGLLLLPVALLTLLAALDLLNTNLNETPVKLPRAPEVVRALGEMITDTAIWRALARTILLSLASTLAATAIGLSIGFPIAYEDHIWRVFQPTVDFLRSIPVTFLVPPLAVIWGIKSLILLLALASYPGLLLMIVCARQGVVRHDRDRSIAFTFFAGRRNRFERFLMILLPEALPDIIVGLRISVSYALVIVTVLEYFSTGPSGGIGQQVRDLYDNSKYAQGFAAITYVGVVGYGLNKLLEWAQFHTAKWLPR